MLEDHPNALPKFEVDCPSGSASMTSPKLWTCKENSGKAIKKCSLLLVRFESVWGSSSNV